MQTVAPNVRQVEVQLPLNEVQAPVLPLPSEDQTRALDDVFATQKEEHYPVVDAINLAAAGMLLHDIVKDTLAPPEDEEEESPSIKPKDKEPAPD